MMDIKKRELNNQKIKLLELVNELGELESKEGKGGLTEEDKMRREGLIGDLAYANFKGD